MLCDCNDSHLMLPVLLQSSTGGIKALITAAGKLSKRDLNITSTVDDKGTLEAVITDKGYALKL